MVQWVRIQQAVKGFIQTPPPAPAEFSTSTDNFDPCGRAVLPEA